MIHIGQPLLTILGNSWGYYLKEVDDLLIVGLIFLPLIVWGIYAKRNRQWSLRSLLMVLAAQAIFLGLAGAPLLQDLLNWSS